MNTPLSVGLVGAGWIGSFHAETLARRAPGDAATGNTTLFADAYVAQFAHFAAGPPARFRAVETGMPVALDAVLR